MPSQDPVLGDKKSCDALELVIVPRARDPRAAAKEEWKSGRFGPVPGETEFIPLPES
jgi:hypothetical protein